MPIDSRVLGLGDGASMNFVRRYLDLKVMN